MDILDQIKKLSALVKNGEMENDIRWESFSRVFVREVRKASLVVDCGAEFGFYIHLVEAFGPKDCRVLAYEPEPPRYEALKLFHNTNPNVEVFPYAVCNHNCTLTLYKADGKSASIDKHLTQWGNVDKVGIEVPARALDELLVNQRADIIKMDIEGAEVLALEGSERILKQVRPLIFLEYHPLFVRSVLPKGKETLLCLLARNGYTIHNHKGLPCDLSAGRVILTPQEKTPSIEFDA